MCKRWQNIHLFICTLLLMPCFLPALLYSICILQAFNASTVDKLLLRCSFAERVFTFAFCAFCVFAFCILCHLFGSFTAAFNIYNGFEDLLQRLLSKTVYFTKKKADRVFLRPALKPKRDVYDAFL